MYNVAVPIKFTLSDMYDCRKLEKLRTERRVLEKGRIYYPKTQAQVADAIGVATMTISRAENGKNCSPYLLWRLALYYGVDWRSLLKERVVPKTRNERKR